MTVKPLYQKVLGSSKDVPIEDVFKDTVALVGESSVREAFKSLRRAKEVALNRENYEKQISKSIIVKPPNLEQLIAISKDKYMTHEGRALELDQYSEWIFNALCMYFANDHRFEEISDGYSIKKGLLLQGPVGCGKSSLLRLFTANHKQCFRFVSCVEVASEFSEHGYKAINKYKKAIVNNHSNQYHGQKVVGWGFDDIGFETDGRHFGKKANVMVEILQSVYNQNDLKGGVHITTNLTADQIRDSYGPRISSRMRQLFNIITYAPKAPDRRK